MPREARPRLSEADVALIITALRHLVEVHGESIDREVRHGSERLIRRLRRMAPGRPWF